MSVPSAKVKAVCTSSEVALVRASRAPVLETLNPGDLRKLAVQARKHFDKWQGLARGQSRDRRRQSGSSKIDANTQLKEQIFRDALDAFVARLAKVDSAAARSTSARPKAKQQRAADHRATRADVRKSLTAVEAKLNAPAKAAKSAAPSAPAAETSAPQPAPVPRKPIAKPAKSLRTAKPIPSATLPVALTKVSPAKQRSAITAAKHSRLVQGGKAGRMVGHSTARGKRSQARRDAKN